MFLANLGILKLMKVFYTIYNKLIYMYMYLCTFVLSTNTAKYSYSEHASYKEIHDYNEIRFISPT